ncbi:MULTISPECIES: peptidase inhibitor family I36 protein [unclassified Streptomyces]|uniref:peptidase inhibitor family I36 protein n=1 Tax=unclassified Streptomyces TaxID=2593676 RepID=UPI000B80423E|nr:MULTISPECIES: peptidase inhibitor family I36 protein [unclassified Streptomyces]MYZ37674.1 hypothetical protein [Streptomyces sp. SID4917]
MRSFRRASVAAVTAVAGVAMLFSATPASAANPPYDGCPGWAICLYEHENGGGSKVIITPDVFGKITTFSVAKAHFLNGKGANDQVTSWLNNTNCEVRFYDQAPSPTGWTGYPLMIDRTPHDNYGARGDWTGTNHNDWLSGIDYHCR